MNRINAYAFVRPILALCGLAAAAAIFVFSPKVPAATFTYTNPSCTSFTISGTPPTQTITCVSSGGGGGVPTCAPTASPPAPAINAQSTLSANCSNTPTSYLWTGGTCGGTTASTCNVAKSRAVTITYSVTATNAAGTSAPAQISVTWQ